MLGNVGRHEEAVKAFKEAIRIKPDLSETHYNLGYAYVNLGQHEKAVAACKKAILWSEDKKAKLSRISLAKEADWNRKFDFMVRNVLRTVSQREHAQTE